MDRETFLKRYKAILNREVSPMVSAQLKKLLSYYSYQDVFHAIWYFYELKGMNKDSVDQFGIGFLTKDTNNMEEATRYFKKLVHTREQAGSSAKEVKNKPIKVVMVKRQKREQQREEYEWDED